jgi:hypothetical protein
MYEVFFEERKLIPQGNLVEVRFEQLEEDPLGQLRRVYAVWACRTSALWNRRSGVTSIRSRDTRRTPFRSCLLLCGTASLRNGGVALRSGVIRYSLPAIWVAGRQGGLR